MNNEVVRNFADEFKAADFQMPKPPKHKLTEFCVFHCSHVEKSGTKFICPRLSCPRDQRLKYHRFLIRKKVLKSALSNFKFYEDIAEEQLTHERDKAINTKKLLTLNTRLMVERVMRMQINWQIKRLGTARKHLQKSVEALDRRLVELQEKKKNIRVPESLVTNIIRTELQEAGKIIFTLNMKIQHANREKISLNRIVQREKILLRALEPANESRGRSNKKGFDTSEYRKKLVERLDK